MRASDAWLRAGLTKVPIDGQPKTIVQDLEDMARTYIKVRLTPERRAARLRCTVAQPACTRPRPLLAAAPLEFHSRSSRNNISGGLRAQCCACCALAPGSIQTPLYPYILTFINPESETQPRAAARGMAIQPCFPAAWRGGPPGGSSLSGHCSQPLRLCAVGVAG